MNRSSVPPRIGRHSPSAGAKSDRAGVDPARPVFHPSIGRELPGHFQSDDDFATIQRWLTRAQIAVAAAALLWMVLPALLMWLAGGTPA